MVTPRCQSHGAGLEMDAELGRSPVEGFLLGELSGHCEYFASGMVVLARSAGIPSRLVNGFAGGQRNEIGDFVEVTRADAHAWVEVHYEEAGWVRYDPTPPSLLDPRRVASESGEPCRRLRERDGVVVVPARGRLRHVGPGRDDSFELPGMEIVSRNPSVD